MGKETKIGLIAGLAFIICFAIILTNRGGPEPLTTHRPYLVDGGDGPGRVSGAFDPLPTGTETFAGAGSFQDSTPASRPSAPVRLDRVGGPGGPVGSPSSGADIVFGDGDAPTRSASSGDQSRSGQQANGLRPLPGADRRTPRRASPPPDDPAARRSLLQEMVDAVMPPPSGPSRPTQSAQPKSGSRISTPIGGVRYKVAAGDTLYKIAARQYGLRSGSDVAAVVEGIFAANRSVMPKPDVLRMGDELILPVVKRHPPRRSTQSAAPTASKPLAGGTQPRRPSDPRHVWYQIRKNDRYVTIARDQLQDATRWREIYELNKDKFPNAGRIREGVRIKLPALRVADAKGRRR